MPKASGESKAEMWMLGRGAAVAASFGGPARRTFAAALGRESALQRPDLMNLNAFLSKTDIYHRFKPKWAIFARRRSIARRSHPDGSSGHA